MIRSQRRSSVLDMSTAAGDIRHPRSIREWSLGAVLAEREIDERTFVLVVRADAGLGASLALGRRLLGLRLAGITTIVVDLGEADHVTDAVLAALMRCGRKLAERDGRLVVSAEHPTVRRALERSGLELAEILDGQ
jgi:anti-anti-sigma regulatory factor